ncbi:triacylglycerol lipase [Frankia sp. AgB1.9]|uniref:esterase/lipase family protein n=1 Tax=unclassified Frankia TaxID=2632575 RepID=UPI001932D0FA|nr:MULTISPECIES: triacylglycerol lipase [unclassified Frankia]MBL7486577.1 triacylglycerol lipase [Frankia sp. AgW1.1]MBL7550480.1 triacylglycerol lipase [Frankia sp. AgB1.9]MBL7624323.1 triacylglycerol lipase [Frankia sp. AgB1.8]
MIKVVRALTAFFVAFGAVLIGTTGTASAATHDPVIFVYGFNGSTSTWTDMVANFEANGWSASQLVVFTYDSHQSNVTTASQLAAKVTSVLASTGASKVDIVSHSMGALSSRYYLKSLGGTAYVDDWVSLGGPNHGTSTANLCALLYTSCSQMLSGSSFLTSLNAGDETPGAVKYGTWWSSCDEVINPDSSVLLSGATNTAAGCLAHTRLHDDATVASQVRAFLS